MCNKRLALLLLVLISVSLFAGMDTLDEIISQIREGTLSLFTALDSGMITFDEAVKYDLIGDSLIISEMVSVNDENMQVFDGGKEGLPCFRDFTNFSVQSLNGEIPDEVFFKENQLTMINLWCSGSEPDSEDLKGFRNLENRFISPNLKILNLLINEAEYEKIKMLFKDAQENKIENASIDSELFSYEKPGPLSFFVNENGELTDQLIIGMMDEKAYERIIRKLISELE